MRFSLSVAAHLALAATALVGCGSSTLPNESPAPPAESDASAPRRAPPSADDAGTVEDSGRRPATSCVDPAPAAAACTDDAAPTVIADLPTTPTRINAPSPLAVLGDHVVWSAEIASPTGTQTMVRRVARCGGAVGDAMPVNGFVGAFIALPGAERICAQSPDHACLGGDGSVTRPAVPGMLLAASCSDEVFQSLGGAGYSLQWSGGRKLALGLDEPEAALFDGDETFVMIRGPFEDGSPRALRVVDKAGSVRTLATFPGEGNAGSPGIVRVDATTLLVHTGTNVYRVPRAGGTATHLADLATNHLASDGVYAWAAGTRQSQSERGVFRIDLATGGVTLVVPDAAAEAYATAIDGRYVYYGRRGALVRAKKSP